MISLDTLEEMLSPWASLYGDSVVIATAVTALHLIGMLLGGGLAIGADRTTLRLTSGISSERNRHLGELNAIHRPVLIAMSVLFATGLLMAAADVATFLVSPVFWVKLTLVALLVINGVVLERTETTLRQSENESLWSRLRVSAMTSIALWIATLVAGVFLVNAA